MIVGHFGIALAARAWRRDAPLLLLVPASVAPDVLDTAYAALGTCNPYGAYSHSWPAIAVLGAVVALIAFLRTRSLVTAAAIGLVALAHVPADYVTGEKLLWMYGPVVGLFLYRWPAADFLVELPLIVAGWWLVRRASAVPRWARGPGALAVLLLVQAAFDLSTAFRPHAPRSGRVAACLDAYWSHAPR